MTLIKMKIEIDFEHLDEKIDNLSYEERNKLEQKFLDFMINLLQKEEKDYCRKKGYNHKEIRKDYKKYFNMRKAVDKRKKVKQANQMLMSFNPMLRRFFRTQNSSQ